MILTQIIMLENGIPKKIYHLFGGYATEYDYKTMKPTRKKIIRVDKSCYRLWIAATTGKYIKNGILFDKEYRKRLVLS